MARALRACGVRRFGTVSHIGTPRKWVFVTDLATMCLGAKVAGVYPWDDAEGTADRITHYQSTAVVVEDAGAARHSEKIISKCEKLPDVRVLVVVDSGDEDRWIERRSAGPLRVVSWRKFLALGGNEPESLEHFLAGADRAVRYPGHVAALVSTSGTTGRPKVIMHSHDSLIYSAYTWHLGCYPSLPTSVERSRSGEVITLSYSPVAHVASFVFDLMSQLAISGHGEHNNVLWLMDLSKLPQPQQLAALREVQPTWWFAGASWWDASKAILEGEAERSPAIRACISAAGSGAEVGKQAIEHLGLQRCKFCASGSSAARPDTLAFFQGLGLRLFEGVGPSEVCGIGTRATPGLGRPGSLGQPFLGTEMKIQHKAGRDEFECEGEILFRSRANFLGYLQQEEATAAAVDGEGWFHSGDIGWVDPADRNLYMYGRESELERTTRGIRWWANPTENAVMEQLRHEIKRCMVVGSGKPEAVVLVIPRDGIALDDAVIRAGLHRASDTVNNGGRLSAWLQVEDFSPENGCLTRRGNKVRRNYIKERYALQIDRALGL